jgi:hypothetical protein
VAISQHDVLSALRPYVEEARRLEGWTFAHVPRPLGAPPPWDYERRARVLVGRARSVLDMGTGGGEVLARILAGYAGLAVATEEWPPNVRVAAQGLARTGAAVVHAQSLRLPVGPASFEVVLNRHEELDPAQVAAMLRPGGTVLTQQIHPDWYAELREFFPRMTRYEPHHETYPRGFEAAGLVVVNQQAHAQLMAYDNLGEIVYTLVAAPWTIPDFELEADLDALLALEQALRRPEGLVLTDRRYIVEARKPS